MAPPRNVREVQQLTGKMVALNRFLSKLGDKGLPFFKILRNTKKFDWTEECQKAFEDLKTYLASLSLLTKSVPGETLFIYLAVTEAAVSSVLLREDEGVQKPPYYTKQSIVRARREIPQGRQTGTSANHGF
ncbi:hypothetical protein Dimus_039401 [Dionaea muscipula]